MSTPKARVRWIDCARLAAMLLVLLDHCYLVLYDNLTLWRLSFSSVGVFILLSGVTSWLSFTRAAAREQRVSTMLVHRLVEAFLPYAVAVALIQLGKTGALRAGDYLSNLLSFSYEPPYYFMLFYLQLVLVSPLLYAWVRFCAARKNAVWWHFSSCAAMLALSVFFTRFTFFDGVFAGAANFFGGSYLFLYYLGMTLCAGGAFSFSAKTRRLAAIPLCALAVVFGGWLAFVPAVDSFGRTLFPSSLNPPGFANQLYCVLYLAAFYCVFSLLEEWSAHSAVLLTRALAFLGRYTLYIYLYHMAIMTLLLPLLESGGIWVLRLVLFPAMVALPVGIGVLLRRLRAGAQHVIHAAFPGEAS